MHQDWVGCAATANQPPTLSGASLNKRVSHSPSARLTLLVFLCLWLCPEAQVAALKSENAGRESGARTGNRTCSRPEVTNNHSAPRHWPESVTWPQPNCKGGWEVWRIRWT